LGKLIGDWALSIWNPRDRSVLLAKDPIGTKHLYYSFDEQQLTWSTILDPLVLFAGKTFEICEEYIAGWFAIMFPAAHLTPYVGIHSCPAVFVRAPPTRKAQRQQVLGFRSRQEASVTAQTPNTKNTSAPSSPPPSSADSAPIAPSSPNSVAAWTLRPLSAWRT
jgi:hypothetical protein